MLRTGLRRVRDKAAGEKKKLAIPPQPLETVFQLSPQQKKEKTDAPCRQHRPEEAVEDALPAQKHAQSGVKLGVSCPEDAKKPKKAPQQQSGQKADQRSL